jgi:hypothetical protein
MRLDDLENFRLTTHFPGENCKPTGRGTASQNFTKALRDDLTKFPITDGLSKYGKDPDGGKENYWIGSVDVAN